MVDPSIFELINIVDTCAVWNILSSTTLYYAANLNKCNFAITTYVQYECLYKKGKNPPSPSREELSKRLRSEQLKNRFSLYDCDIEDLLALEKQLHKRMGKGELTSIALAMKIRRAVLTDDYSARKFAIKIGYDLVQTTPHLFAWLIFHCYLGDSDKNKVIAEHLSFDRNLKKDLEDAYETALQCRLNCGNRSRPD